MEQLVFYTGSAVIVILVFFILLRIYKEYLDKRTYINPLTNKQYIFTGEILKNSFNNQRVFVCKDEDKNKVFIDEVIFSKFINKKEFKYGGEH